MFKHIFFTFCRREALLWWVKKLMVVGIARASISIFCFSWFKKRVATTSKAEFSSVSRMRLMWPMVGLEFKLASSCRPFLVFKNCRGRRQRQLWTKRLVACPRGASNPNVNQMFCHIFLFLCLSVISWLSCVFCLFSLWSAIIHWHI